MTSIPANHRPSLRLVRDEEVVDDRPRVLRPARRAAPRDAADQHHADFAQRRVARETRRAAINPDLDPSDPRWTLAMATRRSLDGAAVNPAARRQLLRLAHRLGMRPFDANMVIAIVQDEARRGALPSRRRDVDSEAAGPPLLDRLRIIPPTNATGKEPRFGHASRSHIDVVAASLISVVLAVALFTMALAWFFSGV